jgi:membrane protein HdeD
MDVLPILNIIAGLILAMGILTTIPALGESLGKIAKWLGRFQTIIGVIMIVLAIWFVLDSSRISLQEVVALVAGLILAMGVLPSIPALGKSLEKLAKWLGGFQTIIGLIAIIVGILGLI